MHPMKGSSSLIRKKDAKEKRSQKDDDIERELVDFMETWRPGFLEEFLRRIVQFYELYDIEDESDWVEEAVGAENVRNVRYIRTVYLLSKLCDFLGPRIITTNSRHPKLWKKLEKYSKAYQPKETENGREDPQNREGNEVPGEGRQEAR